MYKLCKDADGDYIVMELYEDEAALAAHGQSETSGPLALALRVLWVELRNHSYGSSGLTFIGARTHALALSSGPYPSHRTTQPLLGHRPT